MPFLATPLPIRERPLRVRRRSLEAPIACALASSLSLDLASRR